MEQRAAVAKRAQDSSERKVKVLEGKLEDSDSKLAEVIRFRLRIRNLPS